jgi:hypothetical protein
MCFKKVMDSVRNIIQITVTQHARHISSTHHLDFVSSLYDSQVIDHLWAIHHRSSWSAQTRSSRASSRTHKIRVRFLHQRIQNFAVLVAARPVPSSEKQGYDASKESLGVKLSRQQNRPSGGASVECSLFYGSMTRSLKFKIPVLNWQLKMAQILKFW